jgi:hypothetical protein
VRLCVGRSAMCHALRCQGRLRTRVGSRDALAPGALGSPIRHHAGLTLKFA